MILKVNIMIEYIKKSLKNHIKYSGLFKQLVVRDVKLKYRRSVLGYIWSVMNPLLTMLVLTIVFSTFFRFDIDNYPVYLLTGNVIFGFFSAATSGAVGSIVYNGALLKKTYVPKQIFVYSKVTSAFVDFGFSLIALIGIMIFTEAEFSPVNLLFVIPALEVYIFSIGVGLFLAQANVFFRDVQYLYGILITILTYLTPLFYPASILPANIYSVIEKVNPLFNYVYQFRECLYLNVGLSIENVQTGFIWAFCSVIIGGFFFHKNQNKFILFI